MPINFRKIIPALIFSMVFIAGTAFADNTAPVVPLQLTPANNSRISGTTVNLTWSAYDNDTGNVTTNFLFFGTSTTPPYNLTTTNNFSGNLGIVRGTTYYWNLTTTDNIANTSSANNFQFYVNQLPSTSNTALNKTRIILSSAVSCNSTLTDSDNATLQAYVQWYNGSTNNYLWRQVLKTGISNATNSVIDTLQTSNLSSGDKWLCSVIATDGIENATSATNSSSVLVNYLPSVSNAAINVTYATTDTPFACNATLTDSDDNSLQSYVTWYNSSSLFRTTLVTSITNATNTKLNSLETSNTAKGESWLCSLMPYDGLENGTQANSSSVVISNFNLSITLNSPTNNTNQTSRTPSFNITFTDSDSETNWTTIFYVNNGTDYAVGRNFTSVSGQYIVVASNISLVDNKYTWFVKTNDTTTEITSTSNNITIDNTGPTLSVGSPLNNTYLTNSISLSVAANDLLVSVSTYFYSLNSGTNTTFTPNTTIEGRANSQNDIVVFVNDSLGNVVGSLVYFRVSLPILGGGGGGGEDEKEPTPTPTIFPQKVNPPAVVSKTDEKPEINIILIAIGILGVLAVILLILKFYR